MIYTNCPNCNKDLLESPESLTCAGCGLDFALHKIARNMSDRHYNAGLKHAVAGNLTSAVNALNTSLQADRRNILARNLRGLIFFHIGRIGEGLSEWLISIKIQPNSNPAEAYISQFEKDIVLVEKYSSAVTNYNEALVFAEKYSEDLSEIRLKRAIEILPNFIDAMNLLTLHHLKKDEKTQAAALAERVLTIDAGNQIAKRYYHAIFQKNYEPQPKAASQRAQAQKTRPQPTRQPAKTPQTSNPFSARTKEVIPKASPLSGILAALLGMGAMFLFMYFLVVPGMVADRDQALADATALTTSIQTSLQNQINALNDEITDLQTQAQDDQAVSNVHVSSLERSINQMTVYLAAHHLSQDDPFNALATLNDINFTQLSPSAAELYSQIREEATPIAQERHFEAGRDLFNAGTQNYAQARNQLEDAARLAAANEPSVVSAETLYLLGRIAEHTNDTARAILYYEAAVELHPTAARRNAINSRLNTLR